MIRNPSEFYSSQPAGFDGEYDWDYLRGVFPRQITPMDIDACVEMYGRFLIFETKKPGTSISYGQIETLKSFLNLQDNQGIYYVTLIYIDGKNPDDFRAAMCAIGNKRYCFSSDSPIEVAERICRLCKLWVTHTTCLKNITDKAMAEIGFSQIDLDHPMAKIGYICRGRAIVLDKDEP